MENHVPLDLPLAQVVIDRDYLTRTRENLFDELWKNPSTKVLVMHKQKVLLDGVTQLKYLTPDSVEATSLLVYLGRLTEDSTPLVLAVIGGDQAQRIDSDPDAWHLLRKSGLGLSFGQAAIFSQALALANWHSTHVFCSSCGGVTVVRDGGWVRHCAQEQRELYPRTDPAIIVGVVDDQDRILLGSQGIWEENRFSILAGFVEPGESLEAAVIREMEEEAGIIVKDPQFLGSQAWPFPFSLMLGFLAKFSSGEVVPDGEEIVNLRWFTKAELKAEAPNLLLPGRLSIARAIIEHWLGEELETGEF